MVELLGGSGDENVKRETQYLVIGRQIQKNDGKTIKYQRAVALRNKGQDIRLLPEQAFYDLLRASI